MTYRCVPQAEVGIFQPYFFMDPDRWRQVDLLLEEALELPQGQRASFLDHVCAGDFGLRRDVEALLEAHDRSDRFWNESALDARA